jgi:hypothetical protein
VSKPLPTHPAADLFPLMGEDELRGLADDIKANGLRQPIVLDGDGRILDGRNRLAACKLADVQPEFTSVNGDDPVALVVSLNVKRRNLTAGQRAIAAAEAWELGSEKVRNSRAKALGQQFAVNYRYIEHARALVERDRAGADAVKSGIRSLKDAYDALMEREGEVRGDSAERSKLRQEHPDLAEQVDEEILDLREALRQAEQRVEDERKSRYAVTMNVLDGLRLLEQPTRGEHIERTVALLDGEMAAQRGEQVTPERLKQVAAFVSALADALELKESS